MDGGCVAGRVGIAVCEIFFMSLEILERFFSPVGNQVAHRAEVELNVR